jgi:2-dehydropantoate 2-reductase
MKIVVFGAGAVGSVIGGYLSEAGEEVTLIGRKEHVDAINKNGLIIDGIRGKLITHPKAKRKIDEKYDLVLLTVKSQDTIETAKEMKPYIEEVPVLSLQNGVRNTEMLAGVLGKESIINSIVFFTATFLEPGKVVHNTEGYILISEAFKRNNKRIEDISKILNKAIKIRIVENIGDAQWTKLMYNLIYNALPALTGLPIQETYKFPEMRRIAIKSLREALNVLDKAGKKFVSIPGFSTKKIKTWSMLPLPVSDFLLKQTINKYEKSPRLGSTLQSIKRGKNTRSSVK